METNTSSKIKIAPLTSTHADRVARMLRKTSAATCAVALAGSMIPATAFAQASGESDYGKASKTEVVYVKADGAGEQTGVYVVNQFQSGTDTQVRDAGTYESVKNLSDDQELTAKGASNVKVNAGQTYLYQGNLKASTETPWSVSIEYKLDGKTVKASDLAGKSGQLEMTLSVKPNEDCENDYADNYLLQISGAFDNDEAWDISAQDATVAQATGSTQLSYMLFPGKSATYTVKAQVRVFEFDGWQLVGVPLAIALDIDDSEFDDATGDLDKLEDASAELNDGAQSLASGSSDLAHAVKTLSEGGLTIGQGLSALSANGADLVSGVTQLQDGVSSQSAQLSAASGQVDVASAQAAYAQAAQTYTATFAGAFTQAFNAAYQQYVAVGVPAGQAQQLAQADAAQLASQATASEYAALEQALTELVTAQATKTGYESAAAALDEVAPNIGQLQSGIAAYVQVTDQLSAGASEWNSGAAQLTSGANSLADGSSELADGTQELQDETTGMSDELIDTVRNKLTDYLNPSFELRDFVNNETEGVSNVQFVYKTDAIEIPNDDGDDDEPEDNRSIFEKLLALFGM